MSKRPVIEPRVRKIPKGAGGIADMATRLPCKGAVQYANLEDIRLQQRRWFSFEQACQITSFFGAGMAAKVIGADTDARADLIAGEAATSANPSILRGKTVGQFLTWLNKKTGDWAR